MKEVLLDYGDSRMRVEVPDSATVVRYGETYTDPPEVDPLEATRRALATPHGMPPLREQAGPGKRVVIAFPDRVKGGVGPKAHRRVAIPLIVEELLAGGTPLENITLVCAGGLHRKNTLEEWYWYLGREIVDQFWPDRLVNHDAEAPDLKHFGQDAQGNVVQCNRLVADADLAIMIGHCAGNPYGGYSCGYKMVVTGITGWRSIGSHHRPSTMYRDDWLGASVHSEMRRQFASIGQAIEQAIGKRFFTVDAVLGQKSQILDVQAGAIPDVERATWPLADRRTHITLDMREPADVLVIGLPRNFHYGPGMGTNPILMSLAIGGQLSRCWHAFREGGVIIAASVCDGWFNPSWFPSYQETYDALLEHWSPEEFLASPRAEAISTDTDYCFRYSNFFTYHPFHAMSMIAGGAVANRRTSAVFIAGAQSPRHARGMGYIPTRTFEEAMEHAQRIVGRAPRVLCTPEAFSGGVAVHLHAAGR
jgi:nickel-dependent lactate racemase